MQRSRVYLCTRLTVLPSHRRQNPSQSVYLASQKLYGTPPLTQIATKALLDAVCAAEMADIEALGTLLGAFLLLGDVLRHCVKKEIESYVAFARGDLGYLHGSGYTPQPKYRSQPRLEPGASKRYLPGIEGKFQGVSEWRYQQKREETTRAHEQFDSHLRNLLSPLLHEEHAELLNMEEVIVDPWHAAWRVAHPGAALQELLAESEEPYAAMLARMVPFMTEVYAEARAEDPSFQKVSHGPTAVLARRARQRVPVL